jgi:hypothetical protein
MQALAGERPLDALVRAPVAVAALRSRALLDEDELDAALSGFVRAGGWVFTADWLDETRTQVRERLAGTPDGRSAAELLGPEPWAAAVASLLGLDQRDGRYVAPGAAPAEDPAADALAAELADRGLDPLRGADRALLRRLEREGRAVVLGADEAISRRAYDEARAVAVAALDGGGELTLAGFRDLLGVSRSVAQLLLERLDVDRVTLRVGEVRRLRKQALRT